MPTVNEYIGNEGEKLKCSVCLTGDHRSATLTEDKDGYGRLVCFMCMTAIKVAVPFSEDYQCVNCKKKLDGKNARVSKSGKTYLCKGCYKDATLSSVAIKFDVEEECALCLEKFYISDQKGHFSHENLRFCSPCRILCLHGALAISIKVSNGKTEARWIGGDKARWIEEDKPQKKRKVG